MIIKTFFNDLAQKEDKRTRGQEDKRTRRQEDKVQRTKDKRTLSYEL